MDVKKSILIAERILPDARMWIRKTSENLTRKFYRRLQLASWT